MKKTALVLGATGISGRALVAHFASAPDWDVIGVARRTPKDGDGARYLSVDMLDPAACRAAFAGLGDVTHVYYTALLNAPSWFAQCAPNAAAFRTAMDALLPVATRLEHVCLLQGTKYYGQHLGPFKTPAKEDDARHMPPNFYYDQQDYLVEASRGASWSWSCARPHVICGFSLGNPLNLIAVLGVYATLSKALGLPLRFPGKPGAYRAVCQATDLEMLVRAMVWMSTDPACANQAFNITNGDFFRYENLWPKLGRYFDMEIAPPQTIDLPAFMADKAPLWDRIVAEHGLAPNQFQDVADWNFANYTFSVDWDVMSSTHKAHSFGFHDFVDTEAMFLRQLDRFRAERVIP